GDRALDLAEMRDRVGESEVVPLRHHVGVRGVDGVGDRRGEGAGRSGDKGGAEEGVGKTGEVHGHAPESKGRRWTAIVPARRAAGRGAQHIVLYLHFYMSKWNE